ncbi:hypothetical protein C0J52_26839 [Blattella germanica]|nr:hypothetical protein C0J52_26839 [Blattella germanica]
MGSTRVSSSESESDSDNEICDEATNRGTHKKDFKPKQEQHLDHYGLNKQKQNQCNLRRCHQTKCLMNLQLLMHTQCVEKEPPQREEIINELAEPEDEAVSSSCSLNRQVSQLHPHQPVGGSLDLNPSSREPAYVGTRRTLP